MLVMMKTVYSAAVTALRHFEPVVVGPSTVMSLKLRNPFVDDIDIDGGYEDGVRVISVWILAGDYI